MKPLLCNGHWNAIERHLDASGRDSRLMNLVCLGLLRTIGAAALVAVAAVQAFAATPTATSGNQYRADTGAAIPFATGTIPTGVGVYFEANVADADGNTISMQVELRKLPATFTGVATHISAYVSSGTRARTATATGLAAGNYGWRYRVIDSTGVASNWVAAGNPDFVVQAVPSVSSISPTTMTANGTLQTLTISGSNFQSGNVVQFKWGVGTGAGVWNTSSQTPSISANQITIGMNPGTVNDTIYARVCRSASATTTADCSSGTQAVSVIATIPVPSVSSISPTTMTANGTLQTLTISGSNFQSGNVVQFKWGVGTGAGVWNTSSQTPSISANQITIGMNPGTVNDTIYARVCRSASATTTADCSSGTQAVSVIATIPVPSVSSISPTTMTANGTLQTLTISGSNFQSGNVVQFKWGVGTGAGVWNTSSQTPSISANQITIGMNPGTVNDTIYARVCRSASATTTADCSSGTQAVSVIATIPVPSVSSISPTMMTANGTLQTLTISGSNFQSGNVVQFKWGVGTGAGVWNTSSQTPSISANQITIGMNPGTVNDTIYARVCRSASATTTADCSSGTQAVSVTESGGGAGFYLSLPLDGYTPYTVPIVSVFDHSMVVRFDTDNRVVMFTGEVGDQIDFLESPTAPHSFKKPVGTPQDQQSFGANLVNYQGTQLTGPTTINYDGHPGYDFSVVLGTNVYASADGTVVVADSSNSTAAGNYIRLEHAAAGYQTQYLHLSEVLVTIGASVARGQLIGRSGNTAGPSGTVGAHLHFEVKKLIGANWISVDPYGWAGTAGADPYPYAADASANLWDAGAQGADYPGAVWDPAHIYNYTPDFRPAGEIRWVVIHTTEDAPGSDCTATRDYFRVSNNANSTSTNHLGASAHYVICRDGKVYQMVRDHDIAHHAGNFSYNEASIGIEHERHDTSNWTEAQFQSSVALVQWLASRYAVDIAFPSGIAPEFPTNGTGIIGHLQVPDPDDPTVGGGDNHKTDPRYWNWEYYRSLFTAGSNHTIELSASPAAGGTVSGSGTFASGSSRTVAATANGSYTFANWTEGGSVVSSSANYTFTLNANRTLVANFSPVASADTVWLDDSVPAGATVGGAAETWKWVSNNPAPFSGSLAHQSVIATGVHQHYFYNTTSPLSVGVNDTLFAYVYLDPANPPSEVMLQWNSGNWEHRAYWGSNSIAWGTDGTASRRYMGPLPALGQWVRLEVPASLVGVQGQVLNGMAFTLFNGAATWDRSGKTGAAQVVNYTIGLSASPAAGGTVSGSGTFASGSSRTVAATANGGYTFANWTEGGSVVSSSASYTFTLNANRTLVANFTAAPVNYTIGLSASPAAGGTVSGSGTFASGSSRTVAATANGGYTFANWTEGGSVVSSSASYTFTLNANRTLVANFSPVASADTVWLDDSVPAGATVGGAAETWKWVSNNPAPFSGSLAHQSVIATGVHQHYFYNTTSPLSVGVSDTLFAYVHLDPANPPSEVMLQWNSGNWEHRAYWGSNSIAWGTDGTASRRYMGPLPALGQWVRLEVPASLVGLQGQVLNGMAFTLFNGAATWDRSGKTGAAQVVNYTIGLSAAPAAGGTVSGSGAYAAGSSRTVTATANSGYTFANWTEGGSVVSSSASYTFTLNADRTLVANFTAAPVNYTIGLSASPAAGGTVSGSGTFASGSSRTVAATANGSYTFANWTEGGSVVSSSANYTFTLNANRTLVANFSPVASADTVWLDDSVPAGATVGGAAETWKWVSNNPAPFSGSLAHQSVIATGVHQHYFYNTTSPLSVGVNDTLFAYVYLDPANPPSEVMLQWNSGNWEHRAYWGSNSIAWGTDGTASRRYMGPLPALGQWVRLEVPASLVGVQGQVLNGMAFTLFNGAATWDLAGKR